MATLEELENLSPSLEFIKTTMNRISARFSKFPDSLDCQIVAAGVTEIHMTLKTLSEQSKGFEGWVKQTKIKVTKVQEAKERELEQLTLQREQFEVSKKGELEKIRQKHEQFDLSKKGELEKIRQNQERFDLSKKEELEKLRKKQAHFDEQRKKLETSIRECNDTRDKYTGKLEELRDIEKHPKLEGLAELFGMIKLDSEGLLELKAENEKLLQNKREMDKKKEDLEKETHKLEEQRTSLDDKAKLIEKFTTSMLSEAERRVVYEQRIKQLGEDLRVKQDEFNGKMETADEKNRDLASVVEQEEAAKNKALGDVTRLEHDMEHKEALLIGFKTESLLYEQTRVRMQKEMDSSREKHKGDLHNKDAVHREAISNMRLEVQKEVELKLREEIQSERRLRLEAERALKSFGGREGHGGAGLSSLIQTPSPDSDVFNTSTTKPNSEGSQTNPKRRRIDICSPEKNHENSWTRLENILNCFAPQKECDQFVARQEIAKCFPNEDSVKKFMEYRSASIRDAEQWKCLMSIVCRGHKTTLVIQGNGDDCTLCRVDQAEFCLQVRKRYGRVYFRLIEMK